MHSNKVPELSSDTGLLQVALLGSPCRAVGSVQGSTPVLQELNGATFKQLVPLAGTLLIYRAKASNPSTLSAVIGEERTPGGPEGSECHVWLSEAGLSSHLGCFFFWPHLRSSLGLLPGAVACFASLHGALALVAAQAPTG